MNKEFNNEQAVLSKRTKYNHATFSVMIRDLDGSISFWNRAAERHYGWSRKDAVGNVSHTLLNTVFPCPLSQINQELMNNGFWEGELIHTLSDGMRVKVLSRWELQADDAKKTPAVVEINNPITTLNPNSAHLWPPGSARFDFIELLLRNKKWWLWPFLIGLLVLGLFSTLADEAALLPLSE